MNRCVGGVVWVEGWVGICVKGGKRWGLLGGWRWGEVGKGVGMMWWWWGGGRMVSEGRLGGEVF